MIERDWITEAGLRAVCYLIPNKHRCGYVEVPVGHPLYGVGYSEATDALASVDMESLPLGKKSPVLILTAGVDTLPGETIRRSPDVVFDVHGGLTYSGGKGKYPVESDGWWFGFDCAHHGDGSLSENRNFPGDNFPVRSEDYVVAECESLARQIENAAFGLYPLEADMRRLAITEEDR
jgi:hypothetical protein